MSEQVLELDPDFFYRTDDMAMVTFLKLSGHQAQRVGWVDGTCYWTFDRSDLLEESVDQFLAGGARVEPREYNRVYSKTKKEFYNSNPRPTPRRRHT